MAAGAYAQDYPRYRDDDRYYDRDNRGYNGRPGYRGGLMDQVQRDLRSAQSRSNPDAKQAGLMDSTELYSTEC